MLEKVPQSIGVGTRIVGKRKNKTRMAVGRETKLAFKFKPSSLSHNAFSTQKTYLLRAKIGCRFLQFRMQLKDAPDAQLLLIFMDRYVILLSSEK